MPYREKRLGRPLLCWDRWSTGKSRVSLVHPVLSELKCTFQLILWENLVFPATSSLVDLLLCYNGGRWHHIYMCLKIQWLNQSFLLVKVLSFQHFHLSNQAVYPHCHPHLAHILTVNPLQSLRACLKEGNKNFTCVNDPSSLHSGMKTASWGFFACSSAWALSNRHLLWPASTKREANPT